MKTLCSLLTKLVVGVSLISLLPFNSYAISSQDVSNFISDVSSTCQLTNRQVPMGFNFYPITIYTPGIGVYDKDELKEVLANGTEVDFSGQIPPEAITDDGKIIGIFIDFDNLPPFINIQNLQGTVSEAPGIWVQSIRTYYCEDTDFNKCVENGTLKEFTSLSDAIKAGMHSYKMFTFWKVMRFIENYTPEDIANMPDILSKNEEQQEKTGIKNFEFYRVYKKVFVPLGSSISIITLKPATIVNGEFQFPAALRYYDFNCVMSELSNSFISDSNATNPSTESLEIPPSPTELSNDTSSVTNETIPEESTNSENETLEAPPMPIIDVKHF